MKLKLEKKPCPLEHKEAILIEQNKFRNLLYKKWNTLDV